MRRAVRTPHFTFNLTTGSSCNFGILSYRSRAGAGTICWFVFAQKSIHLVASFIMVQPHYVNFLIYYLKRINLIPPVFIMFSDDYKFSHLSTSFDNRIPWRLN